MAISSAEPTTLPRADSAAAAPPTVCIVALPGWRADLAASRLAAAAATGRVKRATIDEAWACLTARPDARAVALIDGPAGAAAAVLAAQPDASLAPAVAAWRAAADALVASVRAMPARWHCLDAAECLDAPQAAMRAAGEGFTGGAPTAAGADAADDGLALLHGPLEAEMPANLTVLDELRALCLVLQTAQAADRLAPLRRFAASRCSVTQRLAALENALVRQRQQALETVAAAGRAGAAQEALYRQQVAAQASQQRQHLAALEALRAEHATALATLCQERDAARQALQQARTDMDSAQARRTELEHRLAEDDAQQAALRAQLDAAQARARRQFEAYARALLDLNRARQELERQQIGGAGATRPGAPTLWAAEFAETERNDAGVHRHIGFGLSHARLGERRWPRLDLRLVEHHGRAGLLLFAQPGPPPLGAWAPTGDEAGRPFMLLVPSESRGRRQLEGLGRSDWRCVTALADWLLAAVEQHGGAARDTWRRTALRLRRELAEMPARLRYDGIVVEQPAAADEGGVTLGLVGAMYGQRELGRLAVRWRTRGGRPSDSELMLIAPPPGCELPLAAWPIDDHGEPSSALMLPVGICGGALRRRIWTSFGPIDAGLVLGVLDTLPALTAALAGTPGRAGQASASLAGPLAMRLREEGHALARRMRWRRWARRLSLRGSTQREGSTA